MRGDQKTEKAYISGMGNKKWQCHTGYWIRGTRPGLGKKLSIPLLNANLRVILAPIKHKTS